MPKFRKKPVVIDAVQWKGGVEDVQEMCDFLAPGKQYTHSPIDPFKPISISTLEGIMLAQIGDYVIRGVNGEYYPCKPDIFAKTYESA